MGRPVFFNFLSWHREPYCLAMDGGYPEGSAIQTSGKLQFRVEGTGRKWEDVIPYGSPHGGTVCIRLLSQRVVDAMMTEGIRGITFYEAEIVEVGEAMLPAEPCPKYFWAEVQGQIVYDPAIERDDRVYGHVPTETCGADKWDFFCLRSSEKERGLCVWACTLKVVEACRKHGIDNLSLVPIDFKLGGRFWDPFAPFRIDLFGDSWPPRWYPEGFPPHPSNQIADSKPIAHFASLVVPRPPQDYLNRPDGVAARWAGQHPIDERCADLSDPQDWRVFRMTEDEVVDVEIELRLVVPDFLRRWLIENPFSDCDHDKCQLMCHKDHIIRYNVKQRREGYYGREWPENLLYIGNDGGGGAYFVDTEEKEDAVYWYDWEQGEGDTVLPIYSTRHTPEEFLNNVLDLPPEE